MPRYKSTPMTFGGKTFVKYIIPWAYIWNFYVDCGGKHLDAGTFGYVIHPPMLCPKEGGRGYTVWGGGFYPAFHPLGGNFHQLLNYVFLPL